MKRRMMGVIAAVVLALVGTLVLVSYVKGAEDRALAGEKTVKVLVAAEAIEVGTPAEDLEGKLEFERVPAKVRAEGAITSIKELGDRVSSADLLPGEQIVKARFIEASDAGAGVPGSQAGEANLLQQTVALAPERAIGGLIKSGDTVAVVSSFDVEGAPDVTHMILHKVRVTNVQLSSDTGSGEQGGESAEGEEAAPAPSGQFLVTLALDAPSVERVVFTAEFGFVYLAAEPQDADEGGTKIVTLENIFQ